MIFMICDVCVVGEPLFTQYACDSHYSLSKQWDFPTHETIQSIAAMPLQELVVLLWALACLCVRPVEPQENIDLLREQGENYWQ